MPRRGDIMTRRLRVALLAAAIILTPGAASAEGASKAPVLSSTSAAPGATRDEVSTPETFPSPIHWAMIAVGVAFIGVAFYIQRRRGFDLD
ncbi:hypothetical protein D3C85_852720 [compost metagenome]